MRGLRAGNDLREGGRSRAAAFARARWRVFFPNVIERVRRRGRRPGVVHAVERIRWPLLINVVERVFICVMRVLLLVVLLVYVLGSHSAFNKRCKVEIAGLKRGYVVWEAEGGEFFAASCL
jgi:hypothetical protein